ncbi:hypothetical protein BDZ91DRAFT_679403, partial [Kalaharituber pfeilii]
MSGSRSGTGQGSTCNGGGSGLGRRRAEDPQIPDVYQEMLRDSGVPAIATRQRKRRKLGGLDEESFIDTAWPSAAGSSNQAKTSLITPAVNQLQMNQSPEKVERPTFIPPETVNDCDSEDDDDGDEDIDWEDVDLGVSTEVNFSLDRKPSEPETLELVLNDLKEQKKAFSERRKITAVDRKIRLEAHKLHLLCLIAHVYRRNKWCNNQAVQENLRGKSLFDAEIIANLDPKPHLHQLERNTRFLKGLGEAVKIWRKKFQITCPGLSQPYWYRLETLKRIMPKEGDPPVTKADFIEASKTLKGSRDLGAQIFCSLLRSVGVTTRLICSLQPLPFSFASKGPPPSLSSMATRDEEYGSTPTPTPSSGSHTPVSTSPAPPKSLSRIRRPGFRSRVSSSSWVPMSPLSGQAPIAESSYPIYWVEAWNVATQKWISVDSLVTGTVGMYSKIEPPQSDPENSMTYVVAFETDGHLKDVTRRYAKQYNAKTRKFRVGSTKGGEQWWNKVISIYHRGWELDRDQVEDSELASRELVEGIPTNIQDFRDHPLFALKRHLRRNQVIHPERNVGTVSTGAGKKQTTETVYRRQDVKIVRSPMQWYRLGREIKAGEQPLKHVDARKKRNRGRGYRDWDHDDCGSGEAEGDGEEDAGETGMYAEFQTELYIPPPVVGGMVPKNSFGNIDVYVESMVPKGGVHIPLKEAAKAAKILGIDYADAVTSFEHRPPAPPTPTLAGVVIATEYKDALLVVIDAIVAEQEEQQAEKKRIEALKLWRKFLVWMRVVRRLEEEYGEVKESEGGQGDNNGE